MSSTQDKKSLSPSGKFELTLTSDEVESVGEVGKKATIDRYIVKNVETGEVVVDQLAWTRGVKGYIFSRDDGEWFVSSTRNVYIRKFVNLETREEYVWGEKSCRFSGFLATDFWASADGKTVAFYEIIWGAPYYNIHFYDFTDPASLTPDREDMQGCQLEDWMVDYDGGTNIKSLVANEDNSFTYTDKKGNIATLIRGEDEDGEDGMIPFTPEE